MSETATPSDARREYEARLARWRPEAETQERAEKRLSNARLAVFFGGLVYLIWVSKEWPDGWATLVLPLAGFVTLVLLHGRARERRVQAARAVVLYERCLARLDDRWAGSGPTGARLAAPNSLFARDLDLFGDGSLFQLVCSCRTRLGEVALADWLQHPADAAEVVARQESVRELAPDVDLREALALLGDEVAEEGEYRDLLEWATAEPVRIRPTERGIAVVLGLAAVAGVVLWELDFGIGPLGLVILVESAFIAWMKKRMDALFKHLEDAGDQLAVLAEILQLLETRAFASPKLDELVHTLDTSLGAPSAAVSRLDRLVSSFRDARYNPFGVAFNLLLQLQVHRAHRVEAWRRAVGSSLGGWMEVAGAFEGLVALGAYAYEHSDDVFPQVVDGEGPHFEAEDLGHPLLPDEVCVRNDLRLGDELRLVLVSGSNMSGKSTFLRSVGVAVVLGLAGAPVRARSLRLSPLRVAASIQIQDSLREGASHFYAEITRLRAIDELARGDVPVLFLLDEILHGTNSTARLKGAEAVVRKLVERGAIGLVTTHDLALAKMADELGPAARNAHFEDQLFEGEMTFDYKMRDGVVERGNALELMRSLGLEV